MAVYARQYGRTGNQLFQKAAAIGYAMKHGLEYNLCPWNTQNTIQIGRPGYIKEATHNYQELPLLRNPRIMLDGYFQSERYFTHCREEVLKAFGYQWMPISATTCSIHLRRGDYLLYPEKHPVINEEYLDLAIKYILDTTVANTFLVFSDDIPFTQQLIESRFYQHCYFEFIEGRSEKEDIELMSSCQHNIIANSTFSWWAAWLNQNPDKVVVSPSKDNWFGPGNSHLDTSDLIPDSWIQIKY